jgi:dTDP-glucose 4,6-dehydratase
LQNIVLVRKLLEILGKPESLITFVKDRPGHDKRYALSCERAEKELGWKPLVTFEDGLSITVKWYTDNRAWCEDIISGDYQEYYRRNYEGRK